MARAQSVEPQVEDVVNASLKEYGVAYKLKQEKLGFEIDEALRKYASKTGGSGGNLPDAKALMKTSDLRRIPVVFEYKGYKDKLEKLNEYGDVDNISKTGKTDARAIDSYAVNGAVHYANALIHYTNFEDIIAVGATGWIDDFGELNLDYGVYLVSKSTMGIGKRIGEYSDLSFLRSQNFENFMAHVAQLTLTDEERARIRDKREAEIKTQLMLLNNEIYKEEKGLSETARVHLVSAVIMATLGVPDQVEPLRLEDLKSSTEPNYRDGVLIKNKIESFLSAKEIPTDKAREIIGTLSSTLLTEIINKPDEGGTSQVKRIATKIVDAIGFYYKVGLTTDFTGALFNEMYSWLGFSQDKLNDVVLTPSYVATLLARLARIDKDSYVWDFATGSAGLLVAAMNEMLDDAKASLNSPDELYAKEAHIKANQLLGIELLPDIYMLAILNMIMMGDGSSNLINDDSLLNYNGNYAYKRKREKFPANAFILNPPFSAPGNGMVFVEKALGMMDHGYAAVIIQGSAGAGRAKEFNRKILKKNTLLASIKMPLDLFVGRSNVQTYIYVFQVGLAHVADSTVRFIDFSNDGYTRTNRRKATTNLRDTGNAVEKYKELPEVVRFGKKKLQYIDADCLYEGEIDPNNGGDWNQAAPIDPICTLEDVDRAVGDFLTWEVSHLLKGGSLGPDAEGKDSAPLNETVQQWGEFKVSDLFDIEKVRSLNSAALVPGTDCDYVTRTSTNQGVFAHTGKIDGLRPNPAGCFSLGLLQMDFFWRDRPWYAAQFMRKVTPRLVLTRGSRLYLTAALNKLQKPLSNVLVRDVERTFLASYLELPALPSGEPDFEKMDKLGRLVESRDISRLVKGLQSEGLGTLDLTASEISALRSFPDSNFREFVMGEVFEKIPTERLPYKAGELPKEPRGAFELPCLTSSFQNQGLNYFVPREGASVIRNAITLPSNSDIYRSYFQPIDFTVLSDAYAIKTRDSRANRHSYLFLVAAINRFTHVKNYSHKEKLGGWQKVKGMAVSLPVDGDDAIDWGLMEGVVSAYKKFYLAKLLPYLKERLPSGNRLLNRPGKDQSLGFWQDPRARSLVALWQESVKSRDYPSVVSRHIWNLLEFEFSGLSPVEARILKRIGASEIARDRFVAVDADNYRGSDSNVDRLAEITGLDGSLIRESLTIQVGSHDLESSLNQAQSLIENVDLERFSSWLESAQFSVLATSSTMLEELIVDFLVLGGVNPDTWLNQQTPSSIDFGEV